MTDFEVKVTVKWFNYEKQDDEVAVSVTSHHVKGYVCDTTVGDTRATAAAAAPTVADSMSQTASCTHTLTWCT